MILLFLYRQNLSRIQVWTTVMSDHILNIVFETIVFVMQTKGGLCKSMEFE